MKRDLQMSLSLAKSVGMGTALSVSALRNLLLGAARRPELAMPALRSEKRSRCCRVLTRDVAEKASSAGAVVCGQFSFRCCLVNRRYCTSEPGTAVMVSSISLVLMRKKLPLWLIDLEMLMRQFLGGGAVKSR